MSEKKIIASDGSELKPGMAVLGKNGDRIWFVSMFSHFAVDGGKDYYCTNGMPFECCIPLEGNEHMAGTKLPIPNKEKPLEWGERVLVWDRPGQEKIEAIFVKYIDDPAPENDKRRWLVLEKGEEDVLGLFAFCERATI